MTIHTFKDEILNEVHAFYDHWLTKQIMEGNERYPSVLEPGEWFEQFLAYVTSTTKP